MVEWVLNQTGMVFNKTGMLNETITPGGIYAWAFYAWALNKTGMLNETITLAELYGNRLSTR